MHINVAIELLRGVFLAQWRHVREIGVVPFSPRTHHTDIDKCEIRITVITRAEGIQQFLRIGDKGWIAEVRHKGFTVFDPLSLNAFFNKPGGDFRARLRFIERHKTQSDVHRRLMLGGDAEGMIDRRKIIDAFLGFQIAPVKAIVFKPGVRILLQRGFLAITIVETGHADPWVC